MAAVVANATGQRFSQKQQTVNSQYDARLMLEWIGQMLYNDPKSLQMLLID